MKNIFTFIALLLIFKMFGQATKRERPANSEALKEKPGGRADRFLSEELISVTPKDIYYEVKYVTYDSVDMPKMHIDSVLYKFNDSYLVTTRYFSSLSVITVPIKVRPSVHNKKQVATADIKNVGVFYGLYNYHWKKYYKDSATSDTKLSVGFILSPAVEKFDSLNTNGYLTKGLERSQLVISTAVGITGSYKGVTVAVIPAGWDIGTSSIRKEWIYNRRYWWGFGIGLDSKIFGF